MPKFDMIYHVVGCLILNSLLFTGEIYQKCLALYQEYRDEINLRPYRLKLRGLPHFLRYKLVFYVFSFFEEEFNWYTFKAIVAAPLLEEWTYRALIFNIYKADSITMAWLLPLYFSFSHAHTFFKNLTQKNVNIKNEFSMMLLKIIYTTVFGFYSGWVYIKTGRTNIYGAMALHTQCNWFGLP